MNRSATEDAFTKAQTKDQCAYAITAYDSNKADIEKLRSKCTKDFNALSKQDAKISIIAWNKITHATRLAERALKQKFTELQGSYAKCMQLQFHTTTDSFDEVTMESLSNETLWKVEDTIDEQNFPYFFLTAVRTVKITIKFKKFIQMSCQNRPPTPSSMKIRPQNRHPPAQQRRPHLT